MPPTVQFFGSQTNGMLLVSYPYPVSTQNCWPGRPCWTFYVLPFPHNWPESGLVWCWSGWTFYVLPPPSPPTPPTPLPPPPPPPPPVWGEASPIVQLLPLLTLHCCTVHQPIIGQHLFLVPTKQPNNRTNLMMNLVFDGNFANASSLLSNWRHVTQIRFEGYPANSQNHLWIQVCRNLPPDWSRLLSLENYFNFYIISKSFMAGCFWYTHFTSDRWNFGPWTCLAIVDNYLLIFDNLNLF